MRTLFRNARLVDSSRDELGDLVVQDGKIVRHDTGETPGARVEIDCEGLVLMPAFIDLHAHFRDPGNPEKEVLESGCLAAAAGGYGTVVAMANTKPVTDDPALARAARRRADDFGLVDYQPVLAMTRGLAGGDDSHLAELEGADWKPLVISDDGRDAADDATMLSAMRRAAALGILVSVHCELDPVAPPPGANLANWYESREAMEADRDAEIRGVERAIRLAAVAGCRLHLAHLSTRETVDLVRLAKTLMAFQGPSGRCQLSCEVTPHHIALSHDVARRLGAAGPGRVNPWLRDEDDRAALIEGLADGTIDAIATDHAPHSAADKAVGAPGFSGLETAFALANTTLCDTQGALRRYRFDLSGLSALLSSNPARVLGLADRGRFEPGLRADLVLVDPEAAWTVDASRFRSRGKNSPLEGCALRGRVLMTMHGGRIVYDQLR